MTTVLVEKSPALPGSALKKLDNSLQFSHLKILIKGLQKHINLHASPTKKMRFLLKETIIIFQKYKFLYYSNRHPWIATINRVSCLKWPQIFEKIMQKFRYTILIGKTNDLDTKILSDQRGSYSWTGFSNPKSWTFARNWS